MKNKLLSLMKEKCVALLRKLREYLGDAKRDWDNSTADDITRSRLFLATVAIVISIILWVFVAWDGNMEGTRSVDVPIQYIGLTPDYTVYDSDKTVSVRVIGRGSMLSRIDLSEFRAEVDLQGMQAGKYKLPIKIEIPSNLRLRSWNPSAATVEIYRQIERTAPVGWKLQGKLPDGRIITKVDISPGEVTLLGPEADVLAIQALEVTIPVGKVGQKGPLKLRVQPTDTALLSERVRITPGEVNVSLTLEDETVGEQIPVKVAVTGEPAEGLEVDTVKLIPDITTVRGRSDAVRAMDSLELSPIDVTGLDQNLQLVLPLQPAKPVEGLEIVGPNRVRLEITLRKKVAAKTYSSVPIHLVGAASDREWVISPAAASLTVEGNQLMIDALFNNEPPCELYVDVSNIVAKRITVPVLVRRVQKEFEVVHVEPEQVTISVVKPEKTQ